MAIYVGVRPEWSMGWLSMVHNDMDLSDPAAHEVLYDMTAEYLFLVNCAIHDPSQTAHPDTIPRIVSEILHARGVVDVPYGKFTRPWWELFTEVKHGLSQVQGAVDFPDAVIDRNGALVGFVFDIPYR